MLDDSAARAAPSAGRSSGTAADPAAVRRFRSCRWHDGEEGAPEFCSHGDVLPYAGRNGFRPEAWCPDCALYKARRSARRRESDFDY